MVDVHIKEARHIQVLIQSNRGDAGRKVDSTHLVEEIELLLRHKSTFASGKAEERGRSGGRWIYLEVVSDGDSR